MAGDDQLIEFVREALNRGSSRESISEALAAAGWSEADRSAAIASFADVDFPIAVPRPRPSLSAREAFEYLVLFGTLYVSAFALGSLLFQFVDLAFPDPRWGEYRLRAIPVAIRWAIAFLVVSAPVFVFMAHRNAGALERSPSKRKSPVRRWLTYLTLAVTSSVLIGDTSSLVYSLLGGEVTTRFVLKTLIIGAIAGTAFYYYLTDLRKDEAEEETP